MTVNCIYSIKNNKTNNIELLTINIDLFWTTKVMSKELKKNIVRSLNLSSDAEFSSVVSTDDFIEFLMKFDSIKVDMKNNKNYIKDLKEAEKEGKKSVFMFMSKEKAQERKDEIVAILNELENTKEIEEPQTVVKSESFNGLKFEYDNVFDITKVIGSDYFVSFKGSCADAIKNLIDKADNVKTAFKYIVSDIDSMPLQLVEFKGL